MTFTGGTQRGTEQAADKTAIRPFHVNVPEAELVDLRRRISSTKWPERELDKGGHFAAWEQSKLFSEEVRAGLRPLRT